MKIQGITLNNYRLYQGVNTISFKNREEKNLFLISGENGFGKTTFLHSLLWCLYGRLMADIEDSIRREMQNCGGYNQLLINNLNVNLRQNLEKYPQQTLDDIKKSGYSLSTAKIKNDSQYSVSINFTEVFIPSIPCKSLRITRSFDAILNKETVEILIDGSLNELATEIGSDVFINDFILNKDIARFFFFDSEKIVSLAETNTAEEKRKLGSAYNEVLGVKKYEDLKKNLENLRLRFRKKSSDIDSRNKLAELLEKQKFFQSTIEKQEKQAAELDVALLTLRKENEQLQEQLLREGNGMTLDELKRLEFLLQTTKDNDIEYKQKLKSFLDYAPFAISGKIFKQTKQQLEHDFSILKSQRNISNQNDLIANISEDLLQLLNNVSIETSKKNLLQSSVQNVLDKYKGKHTNDMPLVEIDKETYNEFLAIYANITSTYHSEFERLADDYRKNKQILDRTARRISNMQNKENDSIIKNIRSKKNNIEKQIADIDKQIKQIHEQRGVTNKDMATVSRMVSELSKKVSLDDSDVKKDQVAEQLISELDTFLSSLKKEKKYSLERRIKASMNALMHKEDFIAQVKVRILEEGIDIDLFSPDGNLIKKDTLSKGEQQLYATSLLKALVDESGIQFPVFIDSPLQKFDKSHSNKIITEFYPTVSKQVVLFPLLYKELTPAELGIMKPLVNAAYLIKNEDSHSFFQQVDINHLMNE